MKQLLTSIKYQNTYLFNTAINRLESVLTALALATTSVSSQDATKLRMCFNGKEEIVWRQNNISGKQCFVSTS